MRRTRESYHGYSSKSLNHKGISNLIDFTGEDLGMIISL